jgi:hypothetical protein
MLRDHVQIVLNPQQAFKLIQNYVSMLELMGHFRFHVQVPQYVSFGVMTHGFGVKAHGLYTFWVKAP